MLKYKNRDKMIFYSFWMTILIVVYHLAPHLIELSEFNEGGRYLRQFFETFGPIALNYFFAVSAYKFFVSEKSCGDKLKKRLVTLIVPYIAWNTIYISLYILQNGLPNIRTVILGYTLTPFDGPLWYIFVLYIYLAISSICMSRWTWLSTKLGWLIIILTFVVAAFHHAVIHSLISFPYDWWVERTLRMAPPFLYGVYCSKHKLIELGRHSTVIPGIISMICLLSSTILGDNVIITLLLYLCTLSLWNVLPNFTLKADSIIKNDMFIIYSIHEGIIIVMLAVCNKGNVHFGKYSSLIFMILLETVLIVTIGFCLNLIIRRLPTVVNIIFTGGRNEHHNKEKKQY
ncbi:acyltransferase family protein [Candidatus Merdisoma sp. HCP28S3_D10]|uniref:acyltransferase family protein n=1 Tax=Candidatus Merdisoma sp. HCP28S3_D10 TaxID=3438869 RepID=UPI003F8C5B70